MGLKPYECYDSKPRMSVLPVFVKGGADEDWRGAGEGLVERGESLSVDEGTTPTTTLSTIIVFEVVSS